MGRWKLDEWIFGKETLDRWDRERENRGDNHIRNSDFLTANEKGKMNDSEREKQVKEYSKGPYKYKEYAEGAYKILECCASSYQHSYAGFSDSYRTKTIKGKITEIKDGESNREKIAINTEQGIFHVEYNKNFTKEIKELLLNQMINHVVTEHIYDEGGFNEPIKTIGYSIEPLSGLLTGKKI